MNRSPNFVMQKQVSAKSSRFVSLGRYTHAGVMSLACVSSLCGGGTAQGPGTCQSEGIPATYHASVVSHCGAVWVRAVTKKRSRDVTAKYHPGEEDKAC